MVWINVLFNKIKFLVVSLVDILRYIFCSTKQRRKLSTDFVPLSSIGIVSNEKFLQISTDDDPVVPNSFSQPINVQDHINYYRQQKCIQMTSEPAEDVSPDFFHDMQPTITKQKKLLIQQNEENILPQPSSVTNSKLSFAPVNPVSKLAVWEDMENTGNWEVDEVNTEELLREERLKERERRMADNMKKRMEKERSRFGSKIS